MKRLKMPMRHALVALVAGWLTSALSQTVTEVVLPSGGGNAAIAQWIGYGVGALVVGGLSLRHFLSKAGVSLSADSYYKQALDSASAREIELKKERDQALAEARTAWASKNADALELGELRARVKFLEEQLQQANATITEIRTGVQQIGRKVDTVKRDTDKVLNDSGLAPLGKE